MTVARPILLKPLIHFVVCGVCIWYFLVLITVMSVMWELCRRCVNSEFPSLNHLFILLFVMCECGSFFILDTVLCLRSVNVVFLSLKLLFLSVMCDLWNFIILITCLVCFL